MRFWRSVLIRFSAVMFCLVPGLSAWAEGEHIHSYTSGFSAAFKAGGELYKSLDPKDRQYLFSQPISLETPEAPQVNPIESNDDNLVMRQVALSAGCIDLLNRVAHAKAIDKIQPGYFDKYLENLSRENGEGSLLELPNIVNKEFWSDDVMNEQMSYFNQIIGMVVAINYSHHYLGHFSKYASKMVDAAGQPIPINNFLTPDEWDKTIRAAAVNSLNCALATEGIEAFFDAINRMPRRPSWTLYFLPKGVDVKRVNEQLTKYEKDYFHGKLK